MSSRFISSKPIDRRTLLRGAGAVALSLPFLEAMGPSLSQRALAKERRNDKNSPKRFVAINAGLGFHGPHLFPTSPGKLTDSTPYLSCLSDNLASMTLFSGLSHPAQQGNNGHASELTFLTSAQRPGLSGFKNTISLDQLIADQCGPETRFPYFALTTRSGSSLSWTANGVPIPGESSPSALFQAMFIEGSKGEVEKQMQDLRRGKSILDTIGERARSMEAKLGSSDQAKLNEYLAAIRDLESRLQQSEGWIQRPKPKVEAKLPKDIADKNQIIGRQKLIYDIMAMAIETDSTRVLTFELGGLNSVPNVQGVSQDWHGLSHHGKDDAKISELKLIEAAEFKAFDGFLSRLRNTTEGDSNLLDQTAVLFGSNLGNASSHDWHNLPIIVAGGGYQHGSYVAHDAADNTPLANLFVSLAQRMDIETDAFGSSTSAGVRGLS